MRTWKLFLLIQMESSGARKGKSVLGRGILNEKRRKRRYQSGLMSKVE